MKMLNKKDVPGGVRQEKNTINPDKTTHFEAGTVTRLNRYLAACGIGSRRACDALISAGRIFLNGQKVTELGTKVSVGKDKVEYLGAVLAPVEQLRYVAVHKPAGIIVTKNDPEGRPTVFDVVEEAGVTTSDLRYVGRLDVNSEGLLLLTNDGDIIHRLTHPRYHVKKIYVVEIDKKLTSEDATRMVRDGIESEGQVLHAGSVDLVFGSAGFVYRVELYEGKKRQIRRMFSECGYKVLRLKRTRFGPVDLGTLAPGKVRDLTNDEIGALRAAGFPASPRKN
jgi:23S rRNA pseudouridine2605 synthase